MSYTTVSISKEVSDLLAKLSANLGMSKAKIIETSVKEYNKLGKSQKKEKANDILRNMHKKTEEFLKNHEVTVEPFDITNLEMGDAYWDEY